MKHPLAACLLSLALLPSCSSTNASDYLLNRGGDLVDIVRVHVMFGKGVAAKLDVTRGLQLGIGWESNVWAWGLANREVGAWRESIFTWGLLLGYHDEKEIVGIDGWYSHSYGWKFGSEGGSSFVSSEPDNPLDFLTLRGTLMLVIGADAEIRFGEVIDFVVGLFQFDPAGDDRPYSTYKRLPEEEVEVEVDVQGS